MVELADTRHSECRAVSAWEFESPFGHYEEPRTFFDLSRVGESSARSHKPGPTGATPVPATLRPSTQVWKSGQVESLVILWVRPPPRSLLEFSLWPDMGCWSNGKTPDLHSGDRGSIPRRSTQRVAEDNGWEPDTVGRAALLKRAPPRVCGFESHPFRLAPSPRW
jgi:hypothetical protein